MLIVKHSLQMMSRR